MWKYRNSMSASALLFALAVGGAACGSDEVDDPFADFDAAEVEYLRETAEANGFEVEDENIMSSLRFRRDCRVFFAALERVDSGGDFFDEDVDGLVERARAEGDSDLAEHYSTMLQSARLGDLADVRSWAEGEGACRDVPVEIPG